MNKEVSFFLEYFNALRNYINYNKVRMESMTLTIKGLKASKRLRERITKNRNKTKRSLVQKFLLEILNKSFKRKQSLCEY